MKNLKLNNADMDFCKICIHDGDDDILVPSQSQISSIQCGDILSELCNGNFISTQSIIIKRSKILNYLLDENMPRLQDYDFVLRAVPDLKVSYTDEVLVDLFRQSDSISNSYEKLKDAVLIMLCKNYKISADQIFSLNKWISDCIKAVFYDKSCQYSELSESYNKLNDEYKDLKKEYNSIVNSKRWKFLTNVCNIIDKFRFK